MSLGNNNDNLRWPKIVNFSQQQSPMVEMGSFQFLNTSPSYNELSQSSEVDGEGWSLSQLWLSMETSERPSLALLAEGRGDTEFSRPAALLLRAQSFSRETQPHPWRERWPSARERQLGSSYPSHGHRSNRQSSLAGAGREDREINCG